jgi:hypothetical protein
MLSQLHVFPFRADSNGNASVEVIVPTNIGLGDHIVRACWSSACPLQTTLHVVSLAAIGTSPVPTESPTAGASPSSSANPTSNPTSNPTPTSGQTTYPSPTPVSNPSPKPAPTPNPYITLVSVSATGNTFVTFHYFYAGSASVSVCQNATCHPAGTVSVPRGTNTVSFKTPAGILPALPLAPETAAVTAGSMASNSVSVGP